MKGKKEEKKSTALHYDEQAADYHLMYQKEFFEDVNAVYPANYFRLQLLLNSFTRKRIKRVIEVGVGEGTPLAAMHNAGVEVWGFDFAPKMVEKSREKMRGLGLDENRISLGDIQDPMSYAKLLGCGPFDGLIAMGVLPHVENDDMVIENMTSLVRPGGSVFIEFRNKLFSLFTLNRLTRDFIMDDLLHDVDEEIRQVVSAELEKRCRMDAPPVQKNAILAKFHNPFEVVEMFKRHNYEDIRLLWYHYHPAMPWLSSKNPELFRKESIKLEHEPSGWRGLFLCSAFVIEAVRKER
ncbi:MAG TPA: class I SAM-dependent methyltransferase [bacterium]|nr:MAG: Ubiquinone biosynthesis O-methyltransferase [bacterium ADurb.Bin236]HOY63831.1 class I SAM-dependent methyltransferase [bacterium]HPI76380.1 class I SAM-dependent methyltransferase [bacterium]HPN95904.1 class I SAM-dependent methyltransferase [bacterium]